MKKTALQNGNSKIIALVAVAIIAIGGMTYYAISGKKADPAGQTADVSALSGQGVQEIKQANGEKLAVEPGNPVVAKVNGQDITRLDVFNFIQSLPENARKLPVEQLFPAALDQVTSAGVIESKTRGVNLDSDPLVEQQLKEAKKNIVRNVYVQRQIEKKITDERVSAAYEQYKAKFPEIEEVKVRHILVADEGKARDLIKQLDGGANSETLAQENSTDGTAKNGGLVGYFAKEEVVPEFSNAAFGQEVGTYSKRPVKTQFGYRIIKVEEKRQRPPAALEQVRPFIEAQLRQVLLNEVISDWRASSSVERFDINGKPVKSSEPAKADKKAEAAVAKESAAVEPAAAPDAPVAPDAVPKAAE